MDKLDLEEVIDVLAEAVSHVTYTCSRTWEAWQYGTMTEEDFMPAEEDDEWLASTVEVITDAINPKIILLEELDSLPVGSVIVADGTVFFRSGVLWTRSEKIDDMPSSETLMSYGFSEIRVVHFGEK